MYTRAQSIEDKKNRRMCLNGEKPIRTQSHFKRRQFGKTFLIVETIIIIIMY